MANTKAMDEIFCETMQRIAESSEKTHEVLQQIARTNEQVARTNEQTHEVLQRHLLKLKFIADTVAIAEMRHCQANAEGTEAARLTHTFFKATSTLWPKSAQEAALEMIYKSGSFKAVRHEGIFSEKGQRRAQLAVALYYKTHVKGDKYFCDIFEDHGEPPEHLLPLMPKFRVQMVQLAMAKDAELGPERVANLPSGSYAERVHKALPEIPEAVLRLNDLMLPINKKFEPSEHGSIVSKLLGARRKNELYETLPWKTKELVEMLSGKGLLTSDDKAVATTESIVKWCWHVKQNAEIEFEVAEEDEKNKRRTLEEAEAEAIRNKRAKTEEAILDGYSKRCLPAVRKLHERYADLLERREAEKQETARAKARPMREAEKQEIEAKGEAGPEGGGHSGGRLSGDRARPSAWR